MRPPSGPNALTGELHPALRGRGRGLRRRIAADEWAVDEALPTTVALAEHYGVSQSTVTRALRILAGEGLVRTVPRWGTFRA